MKQVKFQPGEYMGKDEYYMVEDSDGTLKCSCGRQLIKIDEQTYQCPGGYPIYRVDAGDVVMDKFGNLMLRKKSHPGEGKNNG